jgi:hypothetical protein
MLVPGSNLGPSFTDEYRCIKRPLLSNAFGKTASFIDRGDLIVFSCGRCKPVSLPGGGAVLCRNVRLEELLPVVEYQKDSDGGKRSLQLIKSGLYNLVIYARLYWLPQSLAFRNLGETRYHPLGDIEAMDPVKLALLPANIVAYKGHNMHVQNALAKMLEDMDAVPAGLIDLPRVRKVSRERRLLGYPILVDTSVRDRLYRNMSRSGLGP